VTLLEQHPEHEQHEGRGREVPAFWYPGADAGGHGGLRLAMYTEYMVSSCNNTVRMLKIMTSI
jgi:hypothetical protein